MLKKSFLQQFKNCYSFTWYSFVQFLLSSMPGLDAGGTRGGKIAEVHAFFLECWEDKVDKYITKTLSEVINIKNKNKVALDILWDLFYVSPQIYTLAMSLVNVIFKSLCGSHGHGSRSVTILAVDQGCQGPTVSFTGRLNSVCLTHAMCRSPLTLTPTR